MGRMRVVPKRHIHTVQIPNEQPFQNLRLEKITAGNVEREREKLGDLSTEGRIIY
jgi:hypothetical protein